MLGSGCRSGIFVFVAGMLISTTAMADAFSYDFGRQLGRTTTDSAWRSISRQRGCDAADDLVAVLGRSVKRIKVYARRYDKRDMIDFAEGYIHGMRGGLREIGLRCTNKCGSIGEVAGMASAVVFCDIADLLQEIPLFIRNQDMPNIICGEPYRIQCEINFETYTQTECAQFSGGSPQAKQQYEGYYLADRGGCCSYNPPRN